MATPRPSRYFFVPSSYWNTLDELLAGLGVEYEQFHTSFINYAIRIVTAASDPMVILPDDDASIVEALRDIPTDVAKYGAALSLYKERMWDTWGPTLGHIGPNNSHEQGQLYLYIRVFSTDERRELVHGHLQTIGAQALALMDENNRPAEDMGELREPLEDIRHEMDVQDRDKRAKRRRKRKNGDGEQIQHGLSLPIRTREPSRREEEDGDEDEDEGEEDGEDEGDIQ